MRRTATIILALPLMATATATTDRPEPRVPLYDNLGSHHYAVTASSDLAQRYFNQGLRLYYAFNHAEAIRAFDEAARLDRDCAMCYWGTALAYGPNINLPMDAASGVKAYAALQTALAARGANERERAIIQALAMRYRAVQPADRASLDTAYADAMRRVVQRFPEDWEAMTLYAEALMILSPWQYWNKDGSPRRDTPAILAHLERVLSAAPDHPGANHFFIHAVEAVAPQRAVPMAERLATLMPGAGHLVHMPGHIYVRVGRYRDAIEANEHAVHADETYIRDQNPALGAYTAAYYPHNYDFLAFAASMIGRSAQAITAAEKVAALSSNDALREPGMTYLQHHMTRHLQLDVRFARWDRIRAALPPPDDLPHARAMWSYAQGRASVARGNLLAAETELETVRVTKSKSAVAQHRLEFNTSGAILAIAEKVLSGHIAAGGSDVNRAIDQLRDAVELEDQLVYGEPPEWTVPVRQELGRLLLQADRATEAEQVFRQDLARFPENGWSLFGLAQSLRAQKRDVEAAAVEQRFEEAWADADVTLNANRAAAPRSPGYTRGGNRSSSDHDAARL